MERDNPTGNGPYFTDEAVHEYAAGQAAEQVAGLAAIAAWLDYDRPTEYPPEHTADMARRAAQREAWEAEWAPVRYGSYGYRNGVPAYPVADALDVPTRPDEHYWSLVGEDCPRDRVHTALGLGEHEQTSGVWQHRERGEQVVRIDEWTPVAGSGMRQPEIVRSVPVRTRIEP